MGKQGGVKKKNITSSVSFNETKIKVSSPKAYDKDTEVFISMSRELKDEGNKLFQKRDYEGAMLKYEKAIKLLPQSHIDVSYLRSNMAACFMEMGLSEFPRAIHECNLALEVTPKYSKALLKRARCYEALNRLEFANRDVNTVLKMEPNNIMATEIADRVRFLMEKKGSRVNDMPIYVVPKTVETSSSSSSVKEVKEKKKKKVKKPVENDTQEKKVEDLRVNEKIEDAVEEKKAEDKLVVEEKVSSFEEEPKRNVKLVFGDDIRWVQLPFKCSFLNLREAIRDRFPNSRAVLVKYKDQEGDLVTITTNEELRWAEACGDDQGSFRLYVFEASPEQDPFFDKLGDSYNTSSSSSNNKGKDTVVRGQTCIDDWIIHFAQLFKEYVGFNSDAYLDLHELGMKLYSEAMEDTVTSEEAQVLFDSAAEKFQEMAALALFNWGNVHMSRARKRVYFSEDASRESVFTQVEEAYEWAQNEYANAGKRYEEALKIKPDLYEGVLALGKQQFEQAKLSWYYAVGKNVDLETWPSSTEALQLYNKAEDNMEKGMQMWVQAEDLHLSEIANVNKVKSLIQKMGLNGLYNRDVSAEEAAEQAANTKAQIYVLWGTMLYERSIMELKLGLPTWQECLEVAIEKFELAGASPTDIAVMIKNHCSNDTAHEGLGFNIDEIIQAWHEMYEAKKWESDVPSFRLEPLLRRRVSKLYHVLENP